MLRPGEERGEVLCENFSVTGATVSSPPAGCSDVPGGALRFRFSEVLWQGAAQKDVFDKCARLVDASLRGERSACVLAYGQTGGGKTFTIFGAEGEGRCALDADGDSHPPAASSAVGSQLSGAVASSGGDEPAASAPVASAPSRGAIPRTHGIVPRTAERCEAILRSLPAAADHSVAVSLIEVYMDKLRDLLAAPDAPSPSSPPNRASLSIREAADGSTFVQGASSRVITSASDVMDCVERGLASRKTAATKMNAASSRSHCILIFTVTGTRATTGERFRTHLHIVDLAGSEKVKQTGTAGSSLDEARSINSSLTALGKVVERLAHVASVEASDAEDVPTPTTASHIPYRDSKLTRLLQPALAGNSQTVLILCCSAAKSNFSETVSTLRFGATMSAIKYTTVVTAGENMREKRQSELRSLQRRLDVVEAERELIGKHIRDHLWRSYLPAQLALSTLMCVACFMLFAA